MKISMYLGTSKDWWAYLGLRSNPAIVKAVQGFDRVIFFDDPRLLPAHTRTPGHGRTKYFFIFWDGMRDAAEMERMSPAVAPKADIVALAVGERSCSSQLDARVEGLYPEGPMRFDGAPLSLDVRSSAILAGARVKALLMPLKNVMQSKGRRRETAGLLFGRRRIVFCGSYGITPQAIAELCARGAVDIRLFEEYPYFSNIKDPSFESYRACLRKQGLFLAKLYDQAAINARFLRSALHLLGREYFIEKLRSVNAKAFVHGYNGGANINVYTTPWYRQHLFLDFGSTAGPGNYPRLADLQYFRKKFVAIDLTGETDELATVARNGELDQRFAAEWKRKAGQILGGVAAG
ncbi:MAG TPA: hypothetical protein VN678_08295 [Acidobacteriaceae bacterium]|nr:hypothetical protein [Acidobacteriaceae bacterium]